MGHNELEQSRQRSGLIPRAPPSHMLPAFTKHRLMEPVFFSTANGDVGFGYIADLPPSQIASLAVYS